MASRSGPIEAYEKLVEQLNGDLPKITSYIENKLKTKPSKGEPMSGWINFMHRCYWIHQNNLHFQQIKKQY